MIFWLLVLSPIYAMFLYPLCMLGLSKIYRRNFKREPIEPTVTLLIAAYNEEKAIAGKLDNSLALDYPRDKLEILVVSDGSTDRTDEIVLSFADRGVRLVRVDGNVGKSAALNKGVKEATGEILCCSDATGKWSENAVRDMVAHYADERVGCVSGRVAYHYDQSLTSQGFGVYQRFVTALRRAEASFGSGFNAPGSIHSVRRSAFMESPPDTFMDMVDPFHTALQGLRTTYEDQAVSWEDSRIRIGDEWQARLRICMRSWRFFVYALSRFPLFKSPMYCFQVASHKFLRWLTGPFLIPIFILNVVLLPVHPIYRVLFACQIVYYALTVLGLLLSRVGVRVRMLSGLVFYNSVNFAYLITFLKYLRGDRVARWTPSR